MHKRKKISIDSKIRKAILEKKTFSLHIDNVMEFKLVTEMITDYLLNEYSERQRLLMFADLLPKVKNAFPKAVSMLEKEGYKIMKGPKDGRLQWITLDEKYRHSIDQDSERTLTQLESAIKNKVRHLKITNPSILPEVKQKTQKLLTAKD